MTKDEALKLAQIALENLEHSNFKRRRLDALIAIKQVLAQPEDRNFCPRCGKRRGGDVNYIHTCTPPQTIVEEHIAKVTSDIDLAVNKALVDEDDDIQDYKKPWVGLTEEEVIEISHLALTRVQAVQMTTAKLKEKNA
jgi:hypothetical protein